MSMSVLRWSIKRWFHIFCILGVTSMVWMLYKLNNTVLDHSTASAQSTKSSTLLVPLQHQPPESFQVPNEKTKAKKKNHPQLAVENKALVIRSAIRTSDSIIVALLYSQYKFDTLTYKKGSFNPKLRSSTLIGYYAIIIIEDLVTYLTMPEEDRFKIDSYSQAYKVGIVFFTVPRPGLESSPYKFPLPFKTVAGMYNSYIVNATPFADIAKPKVVHDMSSVKEWVHFYPTDNKHTPLAYGVSTLTNATSTLAVLDLGLVDGVVKVIFGHQHRLWMHKILFLDALSFLTNGAMKLPKIKYIQIDIDDVFLGSNGTKMKAVDVLELRNAQKDWRENYVPGFNFYLGFNGKAFKTGWPEEQDGDVELIKQASHFKWFDHTFGHVKAHRYNNLSKLIEQMELSKQFAKTHNITVSKVYSVAPHHSGVFPVHEQLYEAWKSVWGIQVTSTEEYPHLKPPWYIRGFIHQGIKVLPRQVCGLYTKNLDYSKYPKGPQALEKNILGGPLFETVLYNYLNIYMTHQQNYAHDRLSIYTFNKLFKLFTTSTTLQLQGAPPDQLAQAYFTRYPKQVNPIWLNPCDDTRHQEIWSDEKSCDKLPSLIVVGPQKTGSTALYTYLKLHPEIEANSNSPTSFEELQFFGSSNYNKGLDWYMQFFSDDATIRFEKSATYFDKEVAAKQMYSLLPKAKIIIILLDPISRAHSWYHHQRAHNDSVAMSLTFDQVVKGEDKSKAAQSLLSHMIKPGFYFEHIQRFRQYYADHQIMYIDGEELKTHPADVMDDIQQFLEVEHKLDYNDLLTFDDEKGFYCVATKTGNSKCLGAGKGRSKYYSDINSETKLYLQRVFATPNSYLKRLLKQLYVPLPAWLED